MKQYEKVLDFLAGGPSTSPEIAAATGLGLRACSAHLSMLASAGVIARGRRMPRDTDACPCCGRKQNGRTPFLYSLASQAAP